MENHPIQLLDIGVKELKILTKAPPEDGEAIDLSIFSLGVGASEFDEKNKIINVALKFQNQQNDEVNVADPLESNLAELTVEIIGSFQIDTDNFSTDNIEHWVYNNAPYILTPYLREYVYSLTQKCGFKPLILPLFKVPTLKIENKE